MQVRHNAPNITRQADTSVQYVNQAKPHRERVRTDLQETLCVAPRNPDVSIPLTGFDGARQHIEKKFSLERRPGGDVVGGRSQPRLPTPVPAMNNVRELLT